MRIVLEKNLRGHPLYLLCNYTVRIHNTPQLHAKFNFKTVS